MTQDAEGSLANVKILKISEKIDLLNVCTAKTHSSVVLIAMTYCVFLCQML